MNMILGPGPSSVATLVIGTGLLENLGCDACREIDGRSERTEAGRVLVEDSGFIGVLSGSFWDLSSSFSEEGLLPDPSDVAFNDVDRLEIDCGFLFGLSDLLNENSGPEFEDEPATAEVVAENSGIAGLLEVRSGTLTSFSPVDLLDGGGPLIVSP